MRGRCGVGTRCVFKNVSRTVSVGAECGVGHAEIMAVIEHARLEIEVRHHVRDQATGQRNVSCSPAISRPAISTELDCL